ncbi:MAG: SIS domain-containing protein [Sphingomonas sp.]
MASNRYLFVRMFERSVTSRMAQEAAEAAAACERQVRVNADMMRDAGGRLRALAPPFVATLARGCSDQAAAFGKVLFELLGAMPTLSQAPSIGALYQATSPRFAGVPLIAISQSGRSPDLLRAAEDAKAKGALLVAVVNDAKSPLGVLGDITIPIHAGAETSVAATKSFIATLVALTHLAAAWSEDDALLGALGGIGDVLRAAHTADWSAALPALTTAEGLLVLGRGYTLPIAGEAALKFKETAGLHAEAFSIAEVAHGPMTLVGAGDPVLVFGPIDAARSGLRERVADFTARGALVYGVGGPDDFGEGATVLQGPTKLHPALHAIACVQSFYGLAETLSRARGRDPDHPPHLAKVTHTL